MRIELSDEAAADLAEAERANSSRKGEDWLEREEP